MKKFLGISVLTLLMVLGITSCGGSDGKTPYIGSNGDWWVGDSDLNVPAKGKDGTSPTVVSINKTGTEGLIDTYTITYSDGVTTSFTVTNGASIYIDSIELTSSQGLVDTYTITFSNGAHQEFNVTNGKDGKGADGKDLTIKSIKQSSSVGLIDTYVINYSDGSKFEFVVTNGKDGLTPFIGDNGNWWIGDNDTGVIADYEKANNTPLTPYSDGLIYNIRTIGGITGYVVTGWDRYDIKHTLLDKYTAEEIDAMYSVDGLKNAHLVIPNYIGMVPVIGVGTKEATLNFGKVTLSKNTIFLGEGTFKDCGYLKEIDFNGCEIKTIPSRCFSNTGIRSVTLPDSVTHIMERAFDGTILKDINLNNIIYFGSRCLASAFIDYVYLTNNVEYVGANAFDNTFVYVEAETIPESWDYKPIYHETAAYGVKNNGEYLYSVENNEVTIYQYLGNKKKLTIPATLDKKPIVSIGMGFNSIIIDDDLFDGMTEEEIFSYLKNPDGYITELIIGNNVKKIDKFTLLNGSMFVYIEDSVEEIFIKGGDGVIGTYIDDIIDGALMSLIVIEDSSKTMFRYESSTSLITYEELVSHDDDFEAIIKADISYNDIYWDSNRDFYYVQNLLSYELLSYKGINQTNIVVPDLVKLLPVKSIGKAAFYMTKFDKLVIGKSVQKIKSLAFFGTRGLIYIPKSVSIINAKGMVLASGSKIYTGAASKQDEWDTNWNPYSREVIYSTTLEEFNNL